MTFYRTAFENELEYELAIRDMILQPRVYNRELLARLENRSQKIAKKYKKIIPSFTADRIKDAFGRIDATCTTTASRNKLLCRRELTVSNPREPSNKTHVTYDILLHEPHGAPETMSPKQASEHLARQAHFGNIREVCSIYRRGEGGWDFIDGIWAYPGRNWKSRGWDRIDGLLAEETPCGNNTERPYRVDWMTQAILQRIALARFKEI